jgi:hypothetical protein
MTDTIDHGSTVLPSGHEYHDVSRRLTIKGDQAIIRRQQELPNNFWDRVAAQKDVSDKAPVGEFLHVAAIPALVVEEWFAAGFNMFDKNVTLQDILARLRLEDKDRLITTSRKI